MKKIIPTAKIGYFSIFVFGLQLGISGTLTYYFFLVLICEKKGKLGMKSETWLLRKKQ
jgi:hypothetical protein